MTNTKLLEDRAVDFIMAVLAINNPQQRSIEECMRLGGTLYIVYQLPVEVMTAATIRVVQAVVQAEGKIYFEAEQRYVGAVEMETARLAVISRAVNRVDNEEGTQQRFPLSGLPPSKPS